METPTTLVMREEPVAPAGGPAGGGGRVAALRELFGGQAGEGLFAALRELLGGPAWGGRVAALRELLGGPAGGDLVAALRELVEHKDRCIQASAFFVACGGSVVLHGTVFNLADNPEHVLVGYGLFTIGAALGFLTLSGSDRLGRSAARVEEMLRGLFH